MRFLQYWSPCMYHLEVVKEPLHRAFITGVNINLSGLKIFLSVPSVRIFENLDAVSIRRRVPQPVAQNRQTFLLRKAIKRHSQRKNTSLIHWITLDYLVSSNKGEKVKASLKDAELLQQFKAVEQFADDDKNVVKKLIDAFIVKKQLQQMAS